MNIVLKTDYIHLNHENNSEKILEKSSDFHYNRENIIESFANFHYVIPINLLLVNHENILEKHSKFYRSHENTIEDPSN